MDLNALLRRLGLRSYKEYGINQLPEEYRDEGRHRLEKIASLTKSGNVNGYYQEHLEWGFFLERVNRDKGLKGLPADSHQKSFVIRGAADLFGYRPAGTQIWSYFANPFGVFGYVAENFDAVRQCLDLLADRVIADGAQLKGVKGTSHTRLIEIYKTCKELEILELRAQAIRHLQLYGNFYVLPHKNPLGGTMKLEVLYPNRMMPVFNRITEEIIEYEYIVGRQRFIYPADAILHLMHPSFQGKWVGSPPLVSAITDVEAALQAKIVNNGIFKSGNMLQGIVALDDPKTDEILSTGPNSDWVREIQGIHDNQFAGSHGAGGLMFMNKVKKFFPLNRMGGMDANFLDGTDHTAKTCAYLLGVPSEKIGINRSSNLQYQAALIEDMLNSQFNDTVAKLTKMSDDFINEKIFPLVGIDDVLIMSAGGFGAITLAASQAIINFAAVGMFTHNEINKLVLRKAPLPPDDPRGNRLVDTSLNRDPLALPAEVIHERINPDLELLSKHFKKKDLVGFSKDTVTIYLGGDRGLDGHIYQVVS